MPTRIIFIVFGLLVANSLASAEDAPRTIEFTDLDGRTHTPLHQPDRKATLLFFVLPDCPISNAYAPEINRIVSEYAKRDVASFIVYVDPDLSAADAKKHAAEFGYKLPVLRDTRLELVKETGVTIAPEVALLGSDA